MDPPIASSAPANTTIRSDRSEALVRAGLTTVLGAGLLIGIVESLTRSRATDVHALLFATAIAPFCLVAAYYWREFLDPRSIEIGGHGVAYVNHGRCVEWRWSEIDEVRIESIRGGTSIHLSLAARPDPKAPKAYDIVGTWAQSDVQIRQIIDDARAGFGSGPWSQTNLAALSDAPGESGPLWRGAVGSRPHAVQ